MTLRYQVFGEPVLRDGSRDPSFRSMCVYVDWVKSSQDFTLMLFLSFNRS